MVEVDLRVNGKSFMIRQSPAHVPRIRVKLSNNVFFDIIVSTLHILLENRCNQEVDFA